MKRSALRTPRRRSPPRGGPIREVRVFDLKQSMQNGGGPACLRLRVALNEQELAAVNPGVVMSDVLHDTLVAWVDKHYRDRLSEADLAVAQEHEAVRAAHPGFQRIDERQNGG